MKEDNAIPMLVGAGALVTIGYFFLKSDKGKELMSQGGSLIPNINLSLPEMFGDIKMPTLDLDLSGVTKPIEDVVNAPANLVKDVSESVGNTVTNIQSGIDNAVFRAKEQGALTLFPSAVGWLAGGPAGAIATLGASVIGQQVGEYRSNVTLTTPFPSTSVIGGIDRFFEKTILEPVGRFVANAVGYRTPSGYKPSDLPSGSFFKALDRYQSAYQGTMAGTTKEVASNIVSTPIKTVQGVSKTTGQTITTELNKRGGRVWGGRHNVYY